jgi:PKD repeat protein
LFTFFLREEDGMVFNGGRLRFFADSPFAFFFAGIALFLILKHTFGNNSNFGGAEAISLATAYATTNASRLIIAPGMPYIVNSSYSVNTTTINIYATYRFDGNDTTWADGPIYVPSRVTFVYPFCNSLPFNIISESPPSCVGGRLLYGYTTIPASLPSVPNRSEYINGEVDILIQGQAIPAIDGGGSAPNMGTFTYLPAPGCPMNESSFHVVIAGSGMFDEADSTPLEYVDSKSNTSLWANIYGLRCSLTPRPPSSVPESMVPVMIPICKNLLPADYPALDPTLYETMFGIGFSAPNDVPKNGIAWQIRMDNLDPIRSGVYGEVKVRFLYPDNTEEIVSPLYSSFNDVLYVHSNGSIPAFVFICYFEHNCTPALVYNEAQLGYLQSCNCKNPGGNLLCNGSNDIVTPVNRTSLPNYDANIIFIDPPTCVFFVNVEGNGSNPLVGVPFTMQSGAFGGIGPILYNWQLTNTPPSAGLITPPTSASSVTAVFNAAGTYTVTHTVSNLNGVTRTCSQDVQVVVGAPIACMDPSIHIDIAPGQMLSLDGTCSSNPLGGPLQYFWILSFGFGPTPVFSTTTGPITTFSVAGSGTYMVTLYVANTASASSVFIQIDVFNGAIPPPPPTDEPVEPAPPPFSCFAPSTPTYIPQIGPEAADPIAIIPLAPPPPASTVPGATPPGGIFGPSVNITPEAMWTAIAIVVAFVIAMVLVVCCTRMAKRYRTMNSSGNNAVAANRKRRE